jgi:beta-glucuronidase
MMRRAILGGILACVPVALAHAAPPARSTLSLNGAWRVIVDPYDNGYLDYRSRPYDSVDPPSGGYALDRQPKDKSELVEYDFDTSQTLMVPGDWNSQDDRLLYYEGTLWYRRLFDYAEPPAGRRVFLRFGAANYQADVYLNGRKLGRHVGGFTPFSFEVTGRLRGERNSLVVRVDNKRLREGVPTLNTDWWNYGGLTRDVVLEEVPDNFVARHELRLVAGTPDRVAVRAVVDGPARPARVRVEIPELGVSQEIAAGADGTFTGELQAPRLVRWSPEQPRLYDVTITAGGDRVSDRVGFRTIATRGGEILLNGRPVFLRGISIHEENPMRGGRAYSAEDARLLLGWAQELGCNFVRLAHYPHNEHMARVADELGLMVWEEIPVYWTIAWENPDTLQNAQNQLTEMIERDANRASVIVWSVANETPVSEPRTRFLEALVARARALDPTRLVSAAMEVTRDPADPDARIVDDPFGATTDLASFNQYVGWYDGLPDRLARVKWTVRSDKPVVVTEFGADAAPGFHADDRTRFSEEYQETLYRETIAMLRKLPSWSGLTPWILADFRSPRRPLPGVQDGWNRKGLIGQNGDRKKAFFVLQRFYRERAAAAKP